MPAPAMPAPSMPAPCPAISLSHLPPTHLLHARLTPVQIGTYTYWLITHRARLAPATTATLFLANVSTQKRGELELRKKGLLLITPTTDPATIDPSSRHSIRLVRLEWLDKSFQLGAVQDLEPYTVTVGEVASAAEDISVRRKRILESAKADRENAAEISKRARFGPRTERERGVARILAITKTPGGKPALKRQESREGSPRRDLPAWVVKKVQPPPARVLVIDGGVFTIEFILVLPLHAEGVAERGLPRPAQGDKALPPHLFRRNGRAGVFHFHCRDQGIPVPSRDGGRGTDDSWVRRKDVCAL